MVRVVRVGGLVSVGRNYGTIAIVVNVSEKVAQNAANLDGGERCRVAALLWDAVAGA